MWGKLKSNLPVCVDVAPVLYLKNVLTRGLTKMNFCITRICFCGITMKNYVERNISSKSQTTLKYATKMVAISSETIIFMFLGVATIHDKHDWNWNFVILTILFCTFFRVLGKKKPGKLFNKNLFSYHTN